MEELQPAGPVPGKWECLQEETASGQRALARLLPPPPPSRMRSTNHGAGDNRSSCEETKERPREVSRVPRPGLCEWRHVITSEFEILCENVPESAPADMSRRRTHI